MTDQFLVTVAICALIIYLFMFKGNKLLPPGKLFIVFVNNFCHLSVFE